MTCSIDSTKPPLTIRLCQPRGFCAGVDRAIQIVVLALKKYGAPVYVRHEIVHNRYVVEGLQTLGAVFIEELSEIPPEHRACPVVFSAHGVPKSVPADAEARNLFYLDATCPLVSKVHKQAMRHQRLGRHVLLIGHAGHPEVIGTMGQLPEGAVTLIETEADVEAFRARRSRGARLRHPDHAVGRGHRRHHPGAAASAFPHDPGAGRRIDLLRHDQPPGGGEGNGRRRRSLPHRRRAEFVQLHAPRRGRRARRREACRCWCSAPSEIPWDAIGDDLDARPVGRRIGAGDHRRRDHRRLSRALRRHRRTGDHGDRNRGISRSCARCAMSN